MYRGPNEVTPNVVVERSFDAPVPFEDIKALSEAADRTLAGMQWRFVRWGGIRWMGKPWPLRLTFRRRRLIRGKSGRGLEVFAYRVIESKPASRDGLAFWTRFVPGLREWPAEGCGCIAVAKTVRDCWRMSRENMRRLIAAQERERHGRIR